MCVCVFVCVLLTLTLSCTFLSKVVVSAKIQKERLNHVYMCYIGAVSYITCSLAIMYTNLYPSLLAANMYAYVYRLSYQPYFFSPFAIAETTVEPTSNKSPSPEHRYTVEAIVPSVICKHVINTAKTFLLN